MKKILICGSSGTLGRNLMQRFGPCTAIAASRKRHVDDTHFTHVSLNCKNSISRIDWDKIDAVVNVAGLMHGSNDDVFEANVTLPVKLAMAARSRGVAQFIHVSSFAVYGDADYISRNSEENPNSFYGKTKLQADQTLLAMKENNFDVAILRIPFLFDAMNPSYFSHLMNFIKLFSFLPQSRNYTARSIMTYQDAAIILQSIYSNRNQGILHAASPTPFNYGILNELMLEQVGKNFRMISIPNSVTKIIKRINPVLYKRAFGSSLLDHKINLSENVQDIEDIQSELRSIINSKFK